MRIYRAVATLACGAQLQETGTLEECIRWSEGVIRDNGGDVTVQIWDTGKYND